MLALVVSIATAQNEPLFVREIVTAIDAAVMPCPPLELDHDSHVLCASLPTGPWIAEFLAAINAVAENHTRRVVYTGDWSNRDGGWEKEIRLTTAGFNIRILERDLYIIWTISYHPLVQAILNATEAAEVDCGFDLEEPEAEILCAALPRAPSGAELRAQIDAAAEAYRGGLGRPPGIAFYQWYESDPGFWQKDIRLLDQFMLLFVPLESRLLIITCSPSPCIGP